MQNNTILVSACLLGVACRYDGATKPSKHVLEKLEEQDAYLIPICPEQLGGLMTPRAPSEICGGDGNDVLCGNARVMSNENEDYTQFFINGANQALNIAKLYGAKQAWLKQSSPSCGCGIIYDGSFTANTIKGDGVCSALFKQDGIDVTAF